MKKTIGILAHVDAGKTTFSEQVLYRTGAIRSLGRVDHKDAFLDLHPVERERGITVFSDQAVFSIGENTYYWVDTPGHADFAAEMERVLPVLDYAVLVVSCTEGVESHTETIWRLLEKHGIPVMLFVNKTDRPDADFEACLEDMRRLLSTDMADMRAYTGGEMTPEQIEAVAACDEALLEMHLEDRYDADAWRQGLVSAVRSRALFPVFAGSALQGRGIDEFLKALDCISVTDHEARSGEAFAARVYKIRHDAQGQRRVYFKILSGSIAVKEDVQLADGTQRINELSIRHGGKNQPVQRAYAGDLVCTPGLAGLVPGDGIGANCHERVRRASESMMAVSVSADASVPRTRLMQALRMLEEEEPTLMVEADALSGELSLRVMGGIQLEVIERIARERFGIELKFGPPRILYMETIARPVVGVGHYEPLKHYAEVWLRLVPAPRGSGISFVSRCHVDELALNWQRLIETHVFERVHLGVQMGAPLTDVCVELIAGRAHLKHTEGGDFRESTYRGIRNALMHAENVLLEPICRFSMRIPEESYGKVMGDLTRMQADTEAPRMRGEWMLIDGTCPYRLFADYPEAFRALTHGRGALGMQLSHYAPVDAPEKILENVRYNPRETDSPDSVFCSHGAGFVVPWNEVRAHAHCAPALADGE